MLFALLSVINHPENKNQKLIAILRIAWWKLNQLFLKTPAVIQLTSNVKCICYPSSSYASLIVYVKYPEYYEMNYVINNLTAQSNFVDIGSGLGDYSLLAASKIKSGKIFAFEPTTEAFSQLKENVSLNKLTKKIEMVPKIVSDKNGYEYFSNFNVTEENTITSEVKNSRKIGCVKLDTFFKKDIMIDLLKIDVEGAELKVLSGAKELIINKQIKKILIELNPKCQHFGYTRQEVLDFLLSNHYKLFRFSNTGSLVRFSKVSQLSNLTVNILAVN